MLIDYLARQLGRLWLRLHPALKATIGKGPDLCLTAAQDRQLQPAKQLQAQAFAAQVWWRAGMAAILLFLPVGVATALSPRPVGTDVGSAVMLALLALMAIAMAQLLIAVIRGQLTAAYLRNGEPLVRHDGVYPTRYDFWAGTCVALGVAAILAYAGLH